MATKSSAAGNARLVTPPSLTLQRRLHARPEKVYAAWTDPEKIARWFGPSQVKAGSVQAEIDLRNGGHYRIAFDVTDGQHHEVGGIYHDVVPNQRLVFSWAWHSTPERESQVTVALKSDGDDTLLTLHHEQLFDEAARDGHESGWIGTLDKLAKFIA
jgi:uncharacterized protein YndB with AHSA1/START domain